MTIELRLAQPTRKSLAGNGVAGCGLVRRQYLGLPERPLARTCSPHHSKLQAGTYSSVLKSKYGITTWMVVTSSSSNTASLRANGFSLSVVPKRKIESERQTFYGSLNRKRKSKTDIVTP